MAVMSLLLATIRWVAGVVGRVPRSLSGRLLRATRFPVTFLLKSFTWDALLLLVPAIMSLATGFRMHTDHNSSSYLTVVCYSVTSLPFHGPTALLVCACVAIFLGVFRFSVISLHTKTAVTYYMHVIMLLVGANLIFGIATIIAGSRIRSALERNSLRQIRNLNEEDSPLQINSRLQEAWDVVQMQLGCCGVNGYTDYSTLPKAKQKQEPLPASCCTIRWKQEMPQVNNAIQCQLDAKLGLRESIYINMPGCHHSLAAWLRHYLYAQVFVMFIAALSQTMALIYSYVIYFRPLRRFEAKSCIYHKAPIRRP